MQDFKVFVEEKRTWYQSIGKVFCPVLNEDVVFNAKGFYHLRYDGDGKQRTLKQQKHRFLALEYAQKVIVQGKKIYDYQVRFSKDGEKKVEYWELGKMIGFQHVTVILRRAGNGSIVFYSVWSKKGIKKLPTREVL